MMYVAHELASLQAQAEVDAGVGERRTVLLVPPSAINQEETSQEGEQAAAGQTGHQQDSEMIT